MRLPRSMLPFLVVILLISPAVSFAREDLPRFEPSSCPIEVPTDPDIDCGYLIVPEDYDHPEGKTIRIRFYSPRADLATVHLKWCGALPRVLFLTNGMLSF